MSQKKISAGPVKKYQYLVSKTHYKKTIKKYSGSKIRVYNSFLRYIDKNIYFQNKETLTKLSLIKKRKTLRVDDILLFKDIVRSYTPREEVILNEERRLILRKGIKKLLQDSEKDKIRITLKAWSTLSDMIYQEIEYLSQLIEKYVIKSNRKTLSHVDIPLIFQNSIDFLL